MDVTRKLTRCIMVTAIAGLLLSFLGATAFAENQITNKPQDEFSAVINQDNVIWRDAASGNSIYLYNITRGGVPQKIADAVDSTGDFAPVIDGSKIAWDSLGDIYLFDLNKNNQPEIVAHNEYQQINPAISGNKIVWQENRNGKWAIWMDDVSDNNPPIQLVNDGQNQVLPAINGSKVVWQVYGQGDWDIYIYDLNDSSKSRQLSIGGNQAVPAIYGNTLVWEDWRTGKGSIYKYDVSSSASDGTKIPNSDDGYDPVIDNGKIVWEVYRNGNWDVDMYTDSTGTTNVANGASNQYFPSVSGNRVIWTDDRNGGLDIYLRDYTPQSSGGGGGGSSSSGKLIIPGAGSGIKSPFTDVLNDYWAVNEIVYLYNYHVVSGFPDHTFRPGNPVTRGELAVMVVKALNLDKDYVEGTQKFSDVSKNHWAYKEIQNVSDKGIMIGYGNGTYRPDVLVNREELVQVLINALHYGKSAGTSVSDDILNKFTDKARIPSWAKEAIKEALDLGIVSGVQNDTFGVGQKATRDQVAVMVYKTVKLKK